MGRLYWRVYAHFLGVLLVVGLAASAVFVLAEGGGVHRALLERAVRHVATLVGESLGDPVALAARVAQLHRDVEVDVTVRDAEGRLLAVAGPVLRALHPDEAREVRAGGIVIVRRPPGLTAIAVRGRPGGPGAIVQLSALRRFPAPGLWRPGLAVGVVLLVVALAVAPLARRIARPVERLTEAARRVGAGELGYRVPLEPVGGRRRRPIARSPGRRDELVELTRAFNDMAERVERLVRGHRELLQNVSHELRSPLARIRVALALVPQEGEAGRRLQAVEADLSELDHLIDAVLTTARLEATGVPPRPGPVAVGPLLLDVAERARHDPVTAGTRIEIEPGPPVELHADGALLRRALWNLVENAAKYGAPPVRLSGCAEDDRVRLVVQDAGEGIAPADRERALAPFARLDRARTPGGAGATRPGFGLGLGLARRVAEVHGGTLVIDAPGAAPGPPGCRVTLDLPREPAPTPLPR